MKKWIGKMSKTIWQFEPSTVEDDGIDRRYICVSNISTNDFIRFNLGQEYIAGRRTITSRSGLDKVYKVYIVWWDWPLSNHFIVLNENEFKSTFRPVPISPNENYREYLANKHISPKQVPSQFSLIRSFFKNIRLVFNILRGKEMGL